VGLKQARENGLYDVRDKIAVESQSLTTDKHHQQVEREARLRGRIDLAQKYKMLLQSQIGYLISFLGNLDEKNK
jgi:hypothetical protein